MAASEAAQLKKKVFSLVRRKEVEAGLYTDGFLLLEDVDLQLWIQNNNPAYHHSVRCLEMRGPIKCDSIGILSELPNLQRLLLRGCPYLQEVPSLPNLHRLELTYCFGLKQLPSLPSLQSLKLNGCHNLQQLPSLPNLHRLELSGCSGLKQLPSLPNLHRLELSWCSGLKQLPSLPNLQSLELDRCGELQELPSLTFLQLSFLKFLDTRIKRLPCSIVTKLPKLRLLLLPTHFRLETLPQLLNDSLVISVQDAHVRKTWKDLKREIQTGAEDQFHFTPRYVQCTVDSGPWIQTSNNGLHSLLKFLDLDLEEKELDRNTMDCIGELPQLTHLYISRAYPCHLPLTFKKITHLSLSECGFDDDTELCFGSQGNPSTLQFLQLLECFELPKQIKFPVSLRRLALESCDTNCLPDSYMASMSKLFDLNTLELSGFKNLELSLLNLNLLKLNIWNCTIMSLPTGLQNLEIIQSLDFCYTRRCCDELQLCLDQLNNLQTLSVTCYQIEVLPSIARHSNLQQLHLKDCFNLKHLPPDWDELVELRTLDVSGTRINFLPPSITKLQKLRHLIVPKCFIWDSLPMNFQHKVTKDVTDDMYYEIKGYYDSSYNSWEDIETMSGSMEGGNQVVLQDSSHNIIPEQASLSRPSNPLPDITQVREDPIGNNYYALPGSQSHGMEILHPDSVSDSYKSDGTHFSNSLKHVVVDPKELQGSHSSNRTDHFGYVISSSKSQELQNLATGNEDCAVPFSPNYFLEDNVMDGHHFDNVIRQDPANPEQLEGNEDWVLPVPPNSISDLNVTDGHHFANEIRQVHDELEDGRINAVGESSSRELRNQQGEEMLLLDSTNSDCVGNVPNDIVARSSSKTQKIEVPEERIRHYMSANMTLEGAAKELKISRSTMKRRLKECGITWSTNTKKKQRQDAKNKEHNTESHSERNSSQLNSVDPSTSAGHDNRAEHIDGSCSTFDVKATYEGETVRIYKHSLSSSIDQLKEAVCEKLGLEVSKFRLEFLDEDNESISLRGISDLEHALRLSKSSGISAVKLSVIAKS